MEAENSEGVAFARAISLVIGWTYFALWSVSFYPQIFVNYRRKTTSGFSPDFPIANILGLSCYTIYSALLLFSPTIRAQYAYRHAGNPPAVAVNDFIYGLHAVIIEVIILSQFLPKLWRFRPDAWQVPSWTMIAICSGCLAYLGSFGLWVGSRQWAGDVRELQGTWLDLTYRFGHVKLFLTVIKYTPQAVLNFKRKSTVGFAISAVLMDLAGSLLSLAQLAIDAALQGGWSGVVGNPAKFALGNVSILFDLVYMAQHYVLYRKAWEKGRDTEREEHDYGEEEPLLRGQ